MFNKKEQYDVYIDLLTAKLVWVLCLIAGPFTISYFKNTTLADSYIEFLTILPTAVFLIPIFCYIWRKFKVDELDDYWDNFTDSIILSATDIYMIIKVYYYLKFMN